VKQRDKERERGSGRDYNFALVYKSINKYCLTNVSDNLN
jgi:hypothetical protein